MSSTGWQQTKQQLGRAHAKVANLRRNSLHQLTSALARCGWAGSRLVEADTFYPSSKTCSGCGYVKAKLPLSERTYRCEHCGIAVDRDLNAARNLAQLVDALVDRNAGMVAGSGPETLKTPVDGDVRPGFGWAVPGEAGSRRQTVRSG